MRCGKIRFIGALVEIDNATGKALNLRRVSENIFD
jgi:hypothetical protein